MKVAVVNPVSSVVLDSVVSAHEQGLIEPILVGPTDRIRSALDADGIEAPDFEIADATSAGAAARTAATLAAAGNVNAIMKGDVKTSALMKAALDNNAKLRTNRLMSHVFQMTLPGSDKALFITDAVLNVQPTLEQKVEIAENAIELLLALGYLRPRIALLSASETVSAAMPSSEDAAELARRAAEGAFPDAVVDGPLALDLAISEEAARIKDVQSEVAGNADVVLVPNIETGNALFKMMAYLCGAVAAGIVLGAKVPIVLTSRADPAAARVASLALTSVYVNNCGAGKPNAEET